MKLSTPTVGELASSCQIACCDLVLRSGLGYTGEQPRLQMLQNREFVDAKVEIFLRQGSRVWAKLAEFPIERQLLTQ